MQVTYREQLKKSTQNRGRKELAGKKKGLWRIKVSEFFINRRHVS